ncbi:hypothetical protein [Rhodoferax mekongensis]|uniref:Uncharacterized protein n=1 Tax=Rhodoferax mekongensis TaxID=3068341 RepID=A0ABZ0B215_9BURK|nr:hypothetical protein [Rhodoferax sp. TBRC 17307]WNO05861.1 hypothetical protein RAN89_05370 [Rhodoferax sp. TBRC 17307]
MDMLLLLAAALGFAWAKRKDQSERIALLGNVLTRFDIEKLMESLTDGYLRALGEEDAERQTQVWSYLEVQEQTLSEQFTAFATEFATQDAAATRVSRLPVALPYAARWWPSAGFDVREAFAVHARGIASVIENQAGLSPKRRAFTLSAELFLMQHTCHWYCRSKTVASARLLARHKTAYQQVLQSVSLETRDAYLSLAGQSVSS